MRSISRAALSSYTLFYAFAVLIAIVTAVDRGPGNRLMLADASPLVSNGIASQLPPRDRLITPDGRHDASASPRLIQKLSASRIDEVASSFNVKAVAHVGINLLIDLASPHTFIRPFMGNDTVHLFAKKVPSWDDHAVTDGNAASPLGKIAGMSIALTLVMIFFIVWM